MIANWNANGGVTIPIVNNFWIECIRNAIREKKRGRAGHENINCSASVSGLALAGWLVACIAHHNCWWIWRIWCCAQKLHSFITTIHPPPARGNIWWREEDSSRKRGPHAPNQPANQPPERVFGQTRGSHLGTRRICLYVGPLLIVN